MAKKAQPKPLADQVVDRLEDLKAGPREAYTNDGAGFVRYVEDNCWALPPAGTEYAPFRFTAWQREAVLRLMERTVEGWRYLTTMWCWPRRYGKTLICAARDLFEADTRPHRRVVLGANSEDQVGDTAFLAVCALVENSPKLRRRMDAGEIIVNRGGEIRFANGSTIRVVSSAEASSLGKGIDLVHLTEACKARDSKLFHALSSSTGDRRGQVWIDSNVGDEENLVWQLLRMAEEGRDPTIGCSYVTHESIEDCVRSGLAPWLSERWLRSRLAQMEMLPGEFRRNHLNKPASGSDRLFTEAQIRACVIETMKHPATPAFIAEAIRPRMTTACIHGAGLDRALSYSRNGDRTVWVDVLKGLLLPQFHGPPTEVFSEDGRLVDVIPPDPFDYWVLRCEEVHHSSDLRVQELLDQAHRQIPLAAVGLEVYQADSTHQWCVRHNIPSQLVHPTSGIQQEMFELLYRAAAGGRLHFSRACWLLQAELERFVGGVKGNKASFGHERSFLAVVEVEGKKQQVRLKDDSVYALANCLWALRDQVPRGPTRYESVAKPLSDLFRKVF